MKIQKRFNELKESITKEIEELEKPSEEDNILANIIQETVIKLL